MMVSLVWVWARRGCLFSFRSPLRSESFQMTQPKPAFRQWRLLICYISKWQSRTGWTTNHNPPTETSVIGYRLHAEAANKGQQQTSELWPWHWAAGSERWLNGVGPNQRSWDLYESTWSSWGSRTHVWSHDWWLRDWYWVWGLPGR